MKKWKCIVGGLMLSPVLINWAIKYILWIYSVASEAISHWGWWFIPILILAAIYVLTAVHLIIRCLEDTPGQEQ